MSSTAVWLSIVLMALAAAVVVIGAAALMLVQIVQSLLP